ncbi:MAG: ABC transporter permease [Gemmatimonadetes bacterium]|nr:ABC transporter permease [Gemmatimonadota bacterium]
MSRTPFLRSLRPGQVRADETEDIKQEIELYLDLRTDELVHGGMDPKEARRLAERRFGDMTRIEAEMRREAGRQRAHRGRTMTMGGLRQDLAFALRTFRRSPGFTLVAVLTLGLALGGNTAIYSVVDAALLQAMPFEDHEELVYLNGYHLVDGEISIRGASFPEFRDWNERSELVSPMAAVGNFSAAVTGGSEAERVAAEAVTAEYFEVLRAQPSRGRTFLTEEHVEPDAFPVVVISHAFWQRRFGLEPQAVGTDLLLNDRPLTIVGVMPEGFGGTALNTDVWIPEAMISLVSGVGILDARGSRFLSVIGRLADGADISTAQAELDVIAADLQNMFPEQHEERYSQIQPFREAYLGVTARLLWVLMGAGIVLLLIAAANVANLLLVRSHGRTREIALRRALGAEGRRIAFQLLTESVVLAGVGGAFGLVLAWVGLRFLAPMIPQGVLPGYVEPQLSVGAFTFSIVVLAFVGVVTGLVPAVASARPGIATTLREGARSAVGGNLRRLRAQHVFVVAQVALALILMVGAGLLTRSFRAELAVDTGSEIEQVAAMRMQLPRSRYDSQESIINFVAELERRVAEVPGVQAASISSDLPFRGGSSGAYIFRQDAPEDRIRFHMHSVTPGYFETLGVTLLEGRFLDATDVGDGIGAAVITAAMVRRVFPDENPIGQTMYLRSGARTPLEIVGVIEDLRYRDLRTSLMAEGNSPDVFFSYWQLPTRTIEVSVTASSPSAIGVSLRQVVADLDPDLPVFQVQPLMTSYEAQTATPRFAAFLMGIFSTLAVVLACVGIYGVLAFAVGQRSREIAIRRAIGATAPSIARSVIGDGLKLTVIGLFMGGIAAAAGARVLESFLFSVDTTDPVTFVSVGGGMLLVAMVAAVVPAVRAMRRDPAEALNTD